MPTSAGNNGGRQMRFTEDELAIIKGAFKDNLPLVKLLRKVFLPEYDPTAPIGQTVDLWMTLDLAALPMEQQIIRIFARNSLIMHVEQQLMQLDVLANQKEESVAERTARLAKDSTK